MAPLPRRRPARKLKAKSRKLFITRDEFIRRLSAEFDTIIVLFPDKEGSNDTFSGLIEEVGEIGKAINELKRRTYNKVLKNKKVDPKRRRRIAKNREKAWRENLLLECVQTAAMAMRLATGK